MTPNQSDPEVGECVENLRLRYRERSTVKLPWRFMPAAKRAGTVPPAVPQGHNCTRSTFARVVLADDKKKKKKKKKGGGGSASLAAASAHGP